MILNEKDYTYDTDTEIMTFSDGTTIKAPLIKWDTPEWKEMLKWAGKYIDILEWGEKKKWINL